MGHRIIEPLHGEPTAKDLQQRVSDHGQAPPAKSAIRRALADRLRTLAHDLRNPLNGAKLHLTYARRLLEEYELEDGILDAMDVVDREIDRAAELVKEQLQPREAPSRTKVSLRALCTRAVRLATGEEEAPGVEVLTDPDADGVEVELDLTRMDQVLLDLLQNAMESALHSGGRVVLSARHNGESATIEVQHESGQPELVRPNGFRYGDPNDPALRVAVRAVAEHGGSLDVEAQPGRTAFHIRLPVCRTQPGLRKCDMAD